MKFVKLIFVLYSCIYCSCTFCQPTTKFLDEFDIQPTKKQFVLSNSLLFNHEIKYGLSNNLAVGIGINNYVTPNSIFHIMAIVNYTVKVSKSMGLEFNSKIEPIAFDDNNYYFDYFNFNLGANYTIKKLLCQVNVGMSKFDKWNYFNSIESFFSNSNPKWGYFDFVNFDKKFHPYFGIGISILLKENNFLIWDYYLQNLKESDGTEKYFKMRDIAYRHIFKNIGFDIGIYRYSSKGYWPKATLYYGIGKNKKLISPF